MMKILNAGGRGCGGGIALLMLPSLSAALSILVPLYSYPSPGAWTPLTDAIASTPTVLFSVIVNPNSGPGAYPPDDDYAAGVANLTAFPNVEILGYVDTAYGSRAMADVEADLDTYAKWNGYAARNINIEGIFFDDVSVDDSGDGGTIAYLRNATDYAKEVLPCRNTVVLNPGVYAPDSYFGFADFVVEYEDSFARYGNASTVAGIAAGFRRQSAVIVNEVPGAQVAKMNDYVGYMGRSGVGMVYYTADGVYGDLSEIASLAAGVKAA